MNTRKQHGFTIIEVVLVLAIAGLIFLMVFIALPALQKGQRDTQRRNDVSRFRAQVNQFQANSKGAVPASSAAVMDPAAAPKRGTFISGYLDHSGGWKDPLTGNDYPLFRPYAPGVGVTLSGKLSTPGTWTYLENAKCDEANDTLITGSGARTYAIAMKLEGSGVTCQDNQ
ncbi:MAG: type II secretion system protein [Candidatus Saccharimonadales bacterium]